MTAEVPPATGVPSVRAELKALWVLAIPLALGQAGQALMGVVDTIVLGQFSATAQGGAGLGNSIAFTVSYFGFGVMLAIDPMVSQAIGAKDPVRARSALWVGVWLALLVSVLLTVAMIVLPFFLRDFKVEPEIADGAATYMWWRVPACLPLMLFVGTRSYLQGLGITRPMVVATVVANVANLVLDVVLVFGVGDWPGMGIAGAAIATTSCSWLQWFMLARALPPAPEGVDRRLSWPAIRQALMLGTPMGLQFIAESGVFSMVGILAGGLGTTEIAAHQVALTCASLTFCVAVGIGNAASVRVGWGVGAKNALAARRSGVVALLSVTAFMALSSLVFVVAPTPLARLMTKPPEVVLAVVSLFVVVAVFQIADGLQAVGAGLLRGAADTRFAFWVNLVGHWAIGLPVALALKPTLGIVGLWWGLSAGLFAVAFALVLRFMNIDLLKRSLVAPSLH